jgi:hypothetical protein
MQATTIGPTPTINPGTLTAITTPVTGWTAITNPGPQAQLGTLAETDQAYMVRQADEVTAEGSCNPSATAAAIELLGAAQTPPQTLTVTVIENTTPMLLSLVGISIPPHSYAVVVYDGGTGWALGAGRALIAQTIYNNKPTGIDPVGTTQNTVADPILGNRNAPFSVPAPVPLYISITVVPRSGTDFVQLSAAIRSALVAAAVAPTLANGVVPNGQLAPGAPVIGSQLEAVVMGVAGVFDVQKLTFGTAPNPTNTAPLVIMASQVATISASTVGTNVSIVGGTYP